MAQVIGSISTINGSFFIKSAEGVVSAAKVGDVINKGDIVIGSGSNSVSDLLTVALNDNSKLISVIGDTQQLFDETMLGLELNSDTVVQNGELNESLLLDTVSSAQPDAQQPNPDATLTLQEIEKLDAAAAGGETTPADGSSGVLLARLENRTGAEVNINTDLRDTSTLSNLSTVETAQIIETTQIIEPVIEPVQIIEPVPLLNAVFSFIGNVTVVEGSGTATISASLNQTPVTPLIITLSNGSTITFGTDYVVGTPVASTPFAVQGDDVYVDPESYNLSISSTTGGGFASVDSSAMGTVIVMDTSDNVTVNLEGSNVNEGAGTATITATLTQAPQSAIIITLSTGDTIEIAAGALKGTTEVSINNDNTSDFWNDASNFTVTVSSVDNKDTSLTTNPGNFENLVNGTSATVNVLDVDNNVTVNLEGSNVNEGAGTATITATLTQAPQSAIIITLSTGDT
ncbi:MAG: hypothetical protein PHE16_09525, partial [Aliarcobacter sp.]|nr:hypothetical protein [Aliarcobacter sp.]